jgi:hypothetical protein
MAHPPEDEVRLRGIHEGISSSALYLEAEHELSLAAYLSEFADIIGKGSVELVEQLATVVAERTERAFGASAPSYEFATPAGSSWGDGLDQALSHLAAGVEALRQTPFWTSDKAVLILTGNRQIWLEATSNTSLTLRPPHGSAVGVDLVRGHFVTDEVRRSRTLVATR